MYGWRLECIWLEARAYTTGDKNMHGLKLEFIWLEARVCMSGG